MRLDRTRSWRRVRAVAAGILVTGLLFAVRAEATELLLKDGRSLRGRMGETTGLAEVSAAEKRRTAEQIVFVNDDLRITFVSRRQIQKRYGPIHPWTTPKSSTANSRVGISVGTAAGRSRRSARPPAN